eukprot:gnl/TRDRNA2_/TRDRNA2_150675_c1_seq1.p3 gnl/TRDRNA2_/TRDRNA2_150675_c1~~gnl/TRDRNA2_/TRDRNA2_150675_c1_seq1.p3  ORF type:complete len:128 (+),score=24.22 gnl/TRDRNA2_/TRDRNA2_150675_c1_seq1:566-949(+)
MVLSYVTGQKDVALAMGTETEAVPAAALITDFTRAATQGLLMPMAEGQARMSPLRRALAHILGEGALLDTAAVASAFNGINKIADACGVKMDNMGGSGKHIENAIKLLEKMDVKVPTNWTSAAALTA